VLVSLLLSKGILFLQDNAAPHKAAITHQKLAELHFEVLKLPVYSPDLAPLDYYLIPNLFIKPKTYKPPLIVKIEFRMKIRTATINYKRFRIAVATRLSHMLDVE
jgi:transposase